MGFISGLLIGCAGGLVLGWVFLPEPAWARELFVRWGWAKPTVP